MKTKRRKAIVKQLAEKYGGTWKYIPFHSTWVCDELNLIAYYVFKGGYDMNGNPTDEKFSLPKSLNIYGLKKVGEKFYPI